MKYPYADDYDDIHQKHHICSSRNMVQYRKPSRCVPANTSLIWRVVCLLQAAIILLMMRQPPPQAQYSLFINSFSLQIQTPSISQSRREHHHHHYHCSNNRRCHRNCRTNVFQSSVGVDANGSTGSSSSNSNNSDDSSNRLQQQQQQLVGINVESPMQALVSSQNEISSSVSDHFNEKYTNESAKTQDVATTSISTAAIDTSNSNETMMIMPDNELLRKNIFNALLLGLTFGYAAYTIFNIDHGMTRGWTQSEIAMRIPLDNWLNYESSLTDRPIATKTAINVIIYLLGDWLSQTAFSGNNVLNFDAARTIRNGFIGLCFGPLVHEYYQFSDHILPVDGGMFIRLQKIIMDQTIYLSVKCSIYISAVGLLQGDDIASVKQNVQTKLPNIVLTAWKFWPLVHLVTYGVIPARHRILWVNCVDLIWNAILATMSQKNTGEESDTEQDIDATLIISDATDNHSIVPPLIYEATLSDESFTTSIDSSATMASTFAATTTAALSTEVDLDMTPHVPTTTATSSSSTAF